MNETKNQIIIFGTSGHAKSVISIIEAEAKWQIHGLLVDPEYRNEENNLLGYKIIGDRSNLIQLQQANITRGFVAIGDNQLRAKITDDLISKDMSLIHIIHPASIVMTKSSIGDGAMIHAQAILGPDCQIGRSTIISSATLVGHDSCVGDYSHLAPGVIIGGRATIGDFSFLGLGAVVLPKVKIGRNVQVSANSVVHKYLGDNVVVVGNPAVVVKRNIPI